MPEVGSNFVSVAPDASGFGRKLDGQIFGQLDTTGKRAGIRFGTALKGGAVLAFGAAAAGGLFLKGAIDAASDLNETVSKTNQVFGSGADAVQDFANRGAKALGQSKTDVLAAASTFGTFGKAAGLGGQDLAKFSTGFVSLATDMASFSNTEPEVAVQAIGAALRGESEPIRQFGVLLDDATLRAEALKLGLIETTSQALTPQQKVLAAQAAIYKQTSDAQGDFARTSDGLANQQRILAANFEDLKSTIGQAFLPVAVAAASALNGMFDRIAPALADVLPLFDRASAAIAGMFSGGGGNGAASFAASLSSTFDAVRSAVAGVVQAFAPFVAAVLPTLIGAGQRIAATLLPAVQSIAGMISSQLIPAFQRILPILTPVVQFLIGVFAGAVIGAINGAVQAIKGFVGIIAGVFNVISALIQGDWAALWAGVKQIAVGAFNAVVGLFRVWLNVGILGIFKQAGKAILNSWRALWSGLRNLAGQAAGQLTALSARALGLIGRAFQAAGRAIANIWRGMWSTVTGATRLAWNVIRAVISTGISAIRGFVTQGLNAIRAGFTNGWNAVKTATSAAWTNIKTAVSNGIGNVVDLLRGLPGKFKSALGDLGSTLYSAGVELIAGLIRGITSKIGELTSKMSEIAGKVKGFLPGSPVKEGPLVSWNNGGAGKRLIDQGIIDGIDARSGAVGAAMTRLTSGITPQGPTLSANVGAAGATGLGGDALTLYLIDENGMVTSRMRAVARREVDSRASDQLLRSGVYA